MRQRGQGLAEYALVLGLLAILAIGSLAFLGGQISGVMSKIDLPAGAPAATVAPTPAPTHYAGEPCSPPKGGTYKPVPPDKWVCSK